MNGLPASEAGMQETITQAAQLLGWVVYHTHDSRHSAAGFPDLILARAGHIFAWELKGERGVVSRDQERWWQELGAGALGLLEARVIRPADLDAALEALELGRWPDRPATTGA